MDHVVAIIVMKCALWKCPSFSLEKRVPTDFYEMLARAEKYAWVEEVYEVYGLSPNMAIREQPLAREF